MLRKSNEIPAVIKSDMRGGNGSIENYTLISQTEAHDTVRLFAKLVLPAGASIGMHEHEKEFEIYYVISGTGVVNDGERDHSIAPGDVYLCDDGERHSVENTGSEPLEIIAIIPILR